MATKIEWVKSSDGSLGKTWNPVAGCTVLTPGCTNCYAMKMAARLEAMGQELYAGLTKPSKAGPVWTGIVRQAPEHVLLSPLKRKKPTTYFVNSMSDLFHEDIPDEWIDKVFAVMALTPQHTFQVLTKRAERMRDYVGRRDGASAQHAVWMLMPQFDGSTYGCKIPPWPLPSVWLGVSTERQQEADERIPLLLQTPAAVRFISAEPLLGPIDLERYMLPKHLADMMAPMTPELAGVISRKYKQPVEIKTISFLDWVIVGGESGPNARPMHPDWPRDIREQCAASGVAFFMKQWGAWAWAPDDLNYSDGLVWGENKFGNRVFEYYSSGHTAFNVGKKAAGRLLDGIEHNDMPQRVTG